MRFVKGVNTIEMYDSVHNMPILRFRRWNKYAMKSSEVGSDFGDFANRMDKAQQFLQKDMKEEARKEIENMRMTVFNAFTENSPKFLQLALFIKTINGKEYNDISDSGLEEVLIKLEKVGLTQGESIEKLKKVKKKSKWNYLFSFQLSFQRMVTKNKLT